MSDPLATNLLGLPYLAAAQAQKHVTHNEALRMLDALVQVGVADTTVTDPPGSPAEGDRYIVAATATGDWAGHENDIAAYADGVWVFFTPLAGWLAFDAASGALLLFDGGDWLPVGDYLGAVTQFGINATADATNRLAVGSNAVLFAAIEAGDGGSGDVRFVVNKETDGDTASLLFQSGYSGRAEVGLAGDTDFVFKVSANGTDWVEAIRIDKDTGLPAILYDNTGSGLTAATVQAAIDEVAAAGGGGAVDSVFGRTGAVVAAASDYDASQVDNDSGVSGSTVADALDALAAAIPADSDDIVNASGVSGTNVSDALDAIAAAIPADAGDLASSAKYQIDATTVQGAIDQLASIVRTVDSVPIADDAVGSIFTLDSGRGGLLMIGTAMNAPSMSLFYIDQPGTTEIVTVHVSGNGVNNGSASPSPGSGTDGKINFYNDGGTIKVSNRLGATINIVATFIELGTPF
ncbi:MAG: DUF2793 domain-containing protein [Bauldia sp.]|uniref:DUF2793 domain-containing protein n=1 Tax=Bauldia sp. TaxID=2575872 RepID=UPI001E097CD7|nr:DUF2793 domain-containing protein [Bauldia sp.]MCB1494164.1 DUF2793 domain-containing protein [Bauldia sp.]